MDEQPVRGVVDALLAAWNGHDMAACADDADSVNVFGTCRKGGGGIEAAHRASQAAIFEASRLSASRAQPGLQSGVRVRFLAADVATAHPSWNPSGLLPPDGAAPPGRTGIPFRVLARKLDGWRIAASQNTDMVQPPA
jgi:uncharacterized protein (TIGR02246 family)